MRRYHIDGSSPSEPGTVFVFGSNLAGRHGGGAALAAARFHGAQYGVGIGLTGSAYAIPTKDERIETMPLHEIAPHVQDFIAYARQWPDVSFFVTRIGCGLAGYCDDDIAPMFADVPDNCDMPESWAPFLKVAALTRDEFARVYRRHMEADGNSYTDEDVVASFRSYAANPAGHWINKVQS
jgi:hypothetical protein